ncbi:MAG: S-layer homology domain-containing protein [bacterium]|nr:S-layer homology domain-containing protein [bacterium]
MLAVVALLATTISPTPALGAGEFSDVSAGGTHEAAIEALADLGVFTGTECGDGLFCPDQPVDRLVMAVWLIRVLGYEVTTAGASRFADVEASAWWSPFVEELADRNITAGCATGPLRYCPDQPVTRAQMAAFLVRAFDLDRAPPAGFTDTEGDAHRTNIDTLAAARITAGCKTGPLRYCPNDPVTRAQMATSLHRALLQQKEQAVEADAIVISDDLPNMDLTDLSTGESVNLHSFVTGDKALLLWFWSPY